MNARSYRLVFSKRLGMHVPVSEVSSAHSGKRRNRGAKARLAAAMLAMLAVPVWAANPPAPTEVPTGANVRYGDIGIAQTGNTLNINQASQNGIIHWNTFNIGSAATVNFNQPNATAATLNRIVGNEASVIQGALNATGAVYVINRNGILFDKGAQVNLHTLVASTLDIKDDELFKNGYLTAAQTEPAFSDAYTQYVGTAPVGMVRVAEGAAITAATGGKVILLAPDVENKGIVTTDTGQVILAAGHKAYFHLTNISDSNTLLRGLLVEVGSGGSAVNLGELAAKQGDVTLIGKLVKQDGIVTATSSVNLNGTIHLLAREVASGTTTDIYLPSGNVSANASGSVEFGENSRTVIMPALDAGKVQVAMAAGKLTQAQVDAYHRGAATLADFYAYMPDTTLQDAQAYSASQIKAEGRDIWVRRDAVLKAPSGNITLQALQRASVDPNKIFLTNPNDPGSFALNGSCLDCRVQIDTGAVLDVSGLRDVAVAMERNVVEVELRGGVVADSPLLHDIDGPLYGKKIKVDIRDTGTVDVNGQSVTRQGTTLADASTYIAQIGRKVDEKMTAGGKVNLYSEGALVVQNDASIDLSGGSISYRTGNVATSQLLYHGRLYDIATAKADLAYTGLGADRVVTEQGYREGKDAGALTIVAPWGALQGDIKGDTVIGERQRGAGGQSGSTLPKGATLKLGIDNPSGPDAGRDYRILNEIVFSSVAQSAAPDHGTALSNELQRTLVLDAAKLKAANIANLSVFTNNAIRVESDQTLDVGPGGSVNLTGASLDILGDIKTPGGSVNLASMRTVYNLAGSDERAASLAAAQGVDPATLDQHLTIAGDIVTAGLWSNDYLARNAAAPVVLNGGGIGISAQGLIDLAAGSLLDASAGAWLKVDGKTWSTGKGGDISLTDNRSIGESEPIRLAGELRSYGLLDSSLKAGRGGKLTISTLKVGIGGTQPAVPDSAELWLAETFFQQGGFSDYAITGANGLNVADDAVVAPRTLTRMLDARRVNVASGASVADFSRPTQLAWGVAKAERPVTHLDLSATSDDLGSLRVGKNVRIDLDPRASLNLTAVRSLTLEGNLSAPGGSIQLELKGPNSGGAGYLADAAIWLGETASISAQGVAHTYRGSDGRIQGEVLDGGSIGLLAHNGYIVAEPGSLLDVSGTQASLDLPRQDTGTGYARSLLASAGGSLRLAASEGIFLAAGMEAAGGSSEATRGSLSIELDRPDIPTDDEVANDYLTGMRSIALYAGNPVFPVYLTKPGTSIADSDNGRAELDAGKLASFDHVSLKSRDRIVFEESLDLALRGRLSLDTASVEVAGSAEVTLDALSIRLGNADPLYQTTGSQVPAPVGGAGVFTANAGVIDLIGNWSLSGAAQANLNSDGDIRLTGVVPIGDDSLIPVGQLSTAGDLTLTATQVYPTTLSEYVLESVKPASVNPEEGSRIAIHSNGSSAAVPLAAGGAVTLKADFIDQYGVLRAPLGRIELDAAKTLTLFDDSLTSVSAEGSLIPYGRVANGQTWIYDLNVGATAKQRSIFSGADGTLNLPTKDVLLKGNSIVKKETATIDLSGGGDLYGYEFTPGSGGSSDYLSAPGVFAILPASAGQAAPFDFQYAQYSYKSAQGTGEISGRALGTGATQQVNPGESVYLSAIPELNIAAGYYTLLPAHYALLPGAVAVRAVTNTRDMTAAQNSQRADGAYLVAGYRSSLGDTNVGQTRWSGFEVASREVVTSRAGFEFQYSAAELKAQTPSGRSEIHDYLASRLIPGIAALYDLSLPKLGPDAGRLGINATTSLQLDGTIDFSHDPGTLGGELDIASSKLAVTDGSAPHFDDPSVNPADYLVLDVDLLSSYGVDSLMLGGTREAIAGDVGSVRVNQVADAVLIETSAEKPLSAPEVMLVSKGSITLAAGSEVRGEGNGSSKNETLVFGDDSTAGSGDGVLVRASSGGLRGVVRKNTERKRLNADGDVIETDGLYTASNALIDGANSVNIDSTYTAFNLGSVEVGKDVLDADGKKLGTEGGALQLGATRVALGEVTDILQGVFVTNELLDSLGKPNEIVLKSYSNFDVYGDATLGNADTQSLILQGAGFAGVSTGTLSIAAKNVAFANPDGTDFDDAAAVGTGTMQVNADTIQFGQGGVKTAGFDTVKLVARGEIAGSNGMGGMTVSKDLSMTAQSIVGYNGSDMAFNVGGKLTTANYVAKTVDGVVEKLPELGSTPLGAKMTFVAESIDHGGKIDMPAGVLTMTAESGDLNLLDGSSIFTGGVVRTFKGVNDTVVVAVAGGSTTLTADIGNLAIASGATVDVSGAGGADAGRLTMHVPNGTFALSGQLAGGVEVIASVPNPWMGSFSLDANIIDDGDADTGNDFSALLQHVTGFGENFSMRQRTGDLVVAADDTIKARRVVLSVDDGVLDIAGKIDAHAADGGWVMAAAGKELYLRDDAEIDARATGAAQRGGEVYLISGMNRDYVADDVSNGALVLENGSTIEVGGTLATAVRFTGNNAGDPDIALTQVTGGRVHLQAPRLGSGAGTDVRITHVDVNNNPDGEVMFGSDDDIGTRINGAALIEVLGNKVFDYSTLGATQMTAIKNDSQSFMNSAGTAKTRLGGDALKNSAAFQVRPGVEVRSDGDLTFSSDYDFGAITAVAQNQPGSLTLRAAGKLLVNGNLSDGFNSATGAILDGGESWSYRLVAGADLAAADPMAVQRNLEAGTGDFVLKGGKLIRTGTGAIQIAAGGDVEIGLNNDGSHNRVSVVYTAGRDDSNPDAYIKPTDSYFGKVSYGVDGGALGIVAAGSIAAPEYGQLTNNWLQRRGTIDSTGAIARSPTWGVAYEYFNQGVGALGGGNVHIEAGRNIDNLSVSLPTTGRDYAAQDAGGKLFETGGGNAEMHADGDIRGSFMYVQKGQGRVTAGGAIGAMPATDLDSDTYDNRNLILAMGASQIEVFARNGLVLETAFNPTVAATGTLAGSLNVSGSYKSSSNTDFFTYGDDSAVRLVSAQGDLLLSNDRARVDEQALFVSEVYGGSAPNFMTGTFVYPGSLTVAAVNGSVKVGNTFAMYPSSQGKFQLLAQGDVTFSGGVAMSDVDPARLPSLQAPSKGFEPADALLFSIQDTAAYHAPDLTHLNDADPVRVYAETGSIEYVAENETALDTLYFPKLVEFLAGLDIRDLSLTAQHVAAGQTSNIQAGRDIRYQPLRIDGYLANNGSGIQVDGPGYLNVAVGRNIDLGSTAGIVSNGNLKNPALPAGGAHITLLSGMGADADGRPRQPDYAAFSATYLAAGSTALTDFAAAIEDFEIRRVTMLQPENTGLSYAEVQTKLKDSTYRTSMKTLAGEEIVAALAAFDASPLDARARRIFYHELEMAGVEANQGLGYERANKAIALFFPGKNAAGDKIAYAGDLSVFFSQIRTNQGGDIELLTPGGSVAVGLVSNPVDLAGIRKASELGLFTVNGGGIRSYVRDNFAVNTSRVFTLGQEKKAARTTEYERLLRDDIMLFSLLGDIDAGKGAKTATAAPPPTYEYDGKGNLKVNLANSIAGSGIGVLLAREVIVPGDVSLIAPSGAVNAGDAGIRASGNLNIAAAHVIGADNIQVSGLSIGVPVAVDTGGLSISGIGSLGDAAQTAGEATRSLAATSEESQKAAQEMKQAMAGFKPSFITVEVLGFGDGTASVSDQLDEAEKNRREEERRRRG
ncbi:MAG: hypothetical protein B7Y41_14125 [Hydrogenophilales bacterium 28-61-23]|nr:MAG: hypothetical protein B7Y41_14125 [Hydrogenophilales bacterium 28-61-23]